MSKIEKVFVEFGGDPSDDKECYKRYTSTEPFEAVGFDQEVIEFVRADKYADLQSKLEIAKSALEFYGKVYNHDNCFREDLGSYVPANSEGTSEIESDRGKLARTTLAEIE